MLYVIDFCLVPQVDYAEVGLSPSPPVMGQESEGENNARWEWQSGDGASRGWAQQDLLLFCEYAAPAFGKRQLFLVHREAHAKRMGRGLR